MAGDSAFFEVLETDLRGLSAEARKSDSIATQISGWLSHTDFPQIKECAERAVLKLRAISQERRGIEAVRNSKDILRPFLLVCESKNPRLVGLALGSIQKLLANDAVSAEGRGQIIGALHQVEKSNDDTVKLKILQTLLTLLQNATYADDEAGAAQILSLCFRAYSHNKSSPTVINTAAATIRQAVAILFDHAVLPGGSGRRPSSSNSGSGGGNGREAAALSLLGDLCSMSEGSQPTWLKCPVTPRSFVLDLLEFVLLHRPQAFHTLRLFTAMLQEKVCPMLESLARSALDPDLDAPGMGECRQVLRCLGALLRKHAALLPDKAPALLELLLLGCSPSRTPWQRIFSLQIVRSLVADASLLYALFVAYDCSIHHDANAVHDIVKVAIDLVKAFVKQASDHPDEDAFGALNTLYMAKAAGKETVPDGDALGPLLAGADVWVGYLALEVLLAVVTDVEVLTDVALAAEANGGVTPVPQQPGSARSVSHSRSASISQRPGSPLQEVSSALCSTLVDVLWRMVLQGLSCVLARASQEALVLALLKGYQCYTYSAGALNEKTARDGFLASLCEFTLAAAWSEEGSTGDRAERGASTTGEGQASESGGTSTSRTSTAAAAPAGQAASAALEARGEGNLVLTTKNLHALRTLFNCAHRLADGLGPSWVHVVDVLNSLDRVLSSQSAATKDALAFEGGDGALPSELYILATAANQLFETTSHMSTDAVVSLLSALAEVSARSLPSSSTVDKPRLAALNRMVETLLYNLYRIQDLWGIFLAHVMEVLRSSNPHVRATAIDALDRCISGALGPASKAPGSTSPTAATSSKQQPAHDAQPPKQHKNQPSTPHTASTSYGEAVEHMLLVALESLYREEREPDVRQGLLRVTLHVLQRHGDGLSRGWVPLLRLLEAVPSWEDSATISLAYQSAEAICSDFLSTIPKEHITRALEVLHLFAAQKAVINISLTAIGVLWNVTDFFGRCRAAAALERSTSSNSSTAGADRDATVTSASSAGSSRRATGDGSGAPPPTPSPASAAAVVSMGQGLGLGVGGVGMVGLELLGGGSGDGSHGTGRKDLSEGELTELLLVVYRLLRNLSMDRRPEVRNSGVRTLFLAVGGQAPRFDLPTWRYCLWEVMFPLIKYVHYMGDTSSSEEAAAVELGKERGKTVHMLMHHSRNTEQKQWDETTVLALNGLGKLLRAHLGGMMAMEGFDTKWDDLMGIVGAVLCAGRRSTGVAAAQLLTGALQAYKPQSASEPAPFMWKRALEAIHAGVKVMAVPQSHVPLQVRTELLNGVASIYAAQKEAFDLQDTQRYLAWCDAFARHPVGTDDQAPVQGVLPPVQKAALLALSHLCPVVLPGIWPETLATLSGLLCPLRAEAQRAAETAAKAAAAAAASTATPSSSPGGVSGSTSSPAAGGGTLVLPARSPREGSSTSTTEEHASTSGTHRSSRNLSSPSGFKSGRFGSMRSPGPDAASAVDAKFLSPLLMTRLIGQLLVLYRDHAPWQVRASHFGIVISALSECMASRATLGPTEDLWRHAALAFNAVVNAGLPAVNIAYVNHQSPPDNTWQALTVAFEGFFGADGAGSISGAESASSQQAGAGASGSRNGVVAVSEPSGHRRRSSTSGQAAPAALSDAEIQASVLDTLTDAVLTACASAPLELRLRLLGVVDRGAAAGATAAHKQWQTTLQHQQQQQYQAQQAAGEKISPATQEPQQEHQPGQQPPMQQRTQQHQQPSSAGRFSQLCIRKLFVLCSRGTDATGANRCLLEVAQLTLPLLLDRCEALLEAFRSSEDAAANAGLQPPALLVEDALCALEAVSMMRLDPAVMDAAALTRPALRSWLDAARLRRGFDDVDRKEQTHLLALYGVCARCCGCREPRMRALLRDVLVAVGQELGLNAGSAASSSRDGGSRDNRLPENRPLR